MNVHELMERDPKRYRTEYERWSYSAADHEWWSYVYENFQSEAIYSGLIVNDIRFSGFWSQGDGAGFTGTIKLHKWMQFHGCAVDYPALYMAYEQDDTKALIDLAHRGYSQTVEVAAVRFSEPEGIFAGLDTDAWLDLVSEQEMRFIADDKIRDYVHDMSHKLYRDLEAEYTHLTSEESFIEFCEFNSEFFEESNDEVSA